MAAKKKAGIKVLSLKALAKKYPGSGIASEVMGDTQLWLPSTFLLLNERMGGGIPYGKMIEIFGMESSGKSLLAFNFAYSAQQLGGVVIWIDAEAAYTKEWAVLNGLDNSRVDLFQENKIEVISDFIMDKVIYWRSVLTNNEPILLITDSIASLECLENMNSSHQDAKAEMGNRAKQIDKMLRTRNPLLSDLGICSIFINQVRAKIGASKFEDPDTTPGGKATAFYASIRLGVYGGKQITGKIKGKEARVGRVSTIRFIKNKVAPPKASIKGAEVYFDPRFQEENIGFKKYFGLAELLVELGVLERKKGASWYTFKGKNFANGDKKLLQILEKDDDLRRKLIRRAGINTISATQKKIDSLSENLYPIPTNMAEYEE